ncbi:MAG: hypothetical protein IJR05_06810 [Acidaminococcaceae bacterium]|nr:hypothetical protein [Acidaminococcaceae bacterium]
MEYHFKRQEISGNRVLFALSLDKKSGKERILIGSETEIIKKFWNDPDAMVYYDEIHPIGTLFINKRSDGTDWTYRGFMPLWNALHSNRWKQPEHEQAAADFCAKMYQSGDPFAIYTAIRLWDGYLRAHEPRDRERAAELFKIDLTGLISPMEKYSAENLLDRSITDTIRQSGDEMKMDVWYPARTDIECVTAYRSFLPVIMYYHARLSDWSLYFRSCKVCDRVFLAKSQKYTMCSDKCRQKMKTQAKRDFDARAIENEYDHIYKNEAQRWLHYIHRMERISDCSPKRLAEIKSAYEDFKSEAKKRKSMVKKGQSSVAEFRDWTIRQLDGIL